jgi:hypothetical protein
MAQARLLLAVLAAALMLALSASAQRFVEGVEDLPLMQGLEPVPDSALSFDAPEGRIVVAYARGSVSAEAVLAFYAATLPQLGWQRLAERSYGREAERLSLDLMGEGTGLTVRFTLAPRRP